MPRSAKWPTTATGATSPVAVCDTDGVVVAVILLAVAVLALTGAASSSCPVPAPRPGGRASGPRGPRPSWPSPSGAAGRCCRTSRSSPSGSTARGDWWSEPRRAGALPLPRLRMAVLEAFSEHSLARHVDEALAGLSRQSFEVRLFAGGRRTYRAAVEPTRSGSPRGPPSSSPTTARRSPTRSCARSSSPTSPTSCAPR